MAYKLIWSPAARDDLHDIIVFIAHDNRDRAMSFGYELIFVTDRLQEFQSRAASCPNMRMIVFARSFFGRIESCIESITKEGFVRLRAFGIQREESRVYKAKPRNYQLISTS
jgi:plasmid stabilization system protein ParE